ncbi:MAG: type II toxin-antitoxin system HigB family toxin [Thermosynechococcaceae cyanobacterium]
MHIITRKRLNEFADKHPTTRGALVRWYKLIKREQFTSFAQLRQEFPSADQVGGLTVFNVGGNKVRLIAAIHYNRKKVYVRAILMHEEYNQDKWKE